MPAAAVPDNETVVIPPTVQINKMSDKFKAAMEKGSASAAKTAETPAPAAPAAPAPITPPAPAPEAPKPVEKAPEKASLVPEPKAPEAPKVEVKAPEKPAVDPKATTTVEPQKLRAEQFKVVETQRDEFRTKWETEQKRAAELEAKLAAAAVPPELESWKTRAEKAEEIVKQVAIAHTPEFKRAFTSKITELQTEAKEAVGAEHADKIAKLLKAPPSEHRDEQIESIAEELSSYKQVSLNRAYSELKRTERERDAELSKSDENIGKLEELHAEQNRQEIAKRRQQTILALQNELPKFSFLPEFRTVEGNAEHNAIVSENTKTVQHIVTSDLPPEERARIAVYAVKGMKSIETDAIRDALISKLQAQIAEMQAANPNLRTTTGSTTEKADAKPLTFGEKYAKAMREGIPAKE